MFHRLGKSTTGLAVMRIFLLQPVAVNTKNIAIFLSFLLSKISEITIIVAIICLGFNILPKISQPNRTAVTGIRLIKIEALDAG